MSGTRRAAAPSCSAAPHWLWTKPPPAVSISPQVVAFLLQHGPQGSLALILNRPTSLTMGRGRGGVPMGVDVSLGGASRAACCAARAAVTHPASPAPCPAPFRLTTTCRAVPRLSCAGHGVLEGHVFGEPAVLRGLPRAAGAVGTPPIGALRSHMAAAPCPFPCSSHALSLLFFCSLGGHPPSRT